MSTLSKILLFLASLSQKGTYLMANFQGAPACAALILPRTIRKGYEMMTGIFFCRAALTVRTGWCHRIREITKKDWKTEVKTLSGNVCLGSEAECGRPAMASACGESGEKSAVICAGMYAAYVAPAPPQDASQVEIDAAMDRGFMTPLFKMSVEDIQTLDRETDIRYDSVGADAESFEKQTRSVSSDQATCSSPMGSFNQCSWTCEGNPKGQKSCRTDLPGVTCVRRLCRASGQWAEPTTLPARQSSSCDGDASVVKDCGGYW